LIKIKKVKRGWILYNSSGGYEHHSHFRNKKSANKCKCLLNKGILPSQPYFQESARRLFSDKEYKQLERKHQKEKYINVQKGR